MLVHTALLHEDPLGPKGEGGPLARRSATARWHEGRSRGEIFITSQPPSLAMFGQIFPRRPVVVDGGGDDAAAGEGLQKAGDVGIGGDLARGDDGVAVGDPHHSFVEGPVAELA